MSNGLDFGRYNGTGELGEATFDKVSVVVAFYRRSVLNPFESDKAGAPVYEGRDFVKVLTPGERDEVDREATPFDRRRWKAQWEAYQEGIVQAPDGTALSHLFPGHPEIVENLAVLRFHTVQQLAEASDHALQSIPMGGVAWRDKARRFLATSKDSSRFAAIEQRLDDQAAGMKTLEERNTALEAENARLKADLAEMDREDAEPAPRRRARG